MRPSHCHHERGVISIDWPALATKDTRQLRTRRAHIRINILLVIPPGRIPPRLRYDDLGE